MACSNHAEVLEGLNRCTRCRKSYCDDCLVELKGGFYCAVCKAEQVKDIQSGVEEKEGPLATTSARLSAIFIDYCVLSLVLGILIGAFQPVLRRHGEELWAAIGMFGGVLGIWTVYEGVMLSWRGQTLGKMAMKVKVVSADGADLSTGQAWLRTVTRVVLLLTLIVDYLPAFFSKNRSAIHDLVAKTRVIRFRT